MAFRYQNCRGDDPLEILFDGNEIEPADTLESLGILFNKECIPYAQLGRVRSNIKTMKTLIRKNYRIRTIHDTNQTHLKVRSTSKNSETKIPTNLISSDLEMGKKRPRKPDSDETDESEKELPPTKELKTKMKKTKRRKKSITKHESSSDDGNSEGKKLKIKIQDQGAIAANSTEDQRT